MSVENDLQEWEEAKKERRRLRGRQRSLKHRILKELPAFSYSYDRWKHYSDRLQEVLVEDARLDPNWIDVERYPLALYNLFTALGFKVHVGGVPRISDVQPDYRTPLFAYNNNRAVLIEHDPSMLFADIADIQPVCPVPIVGLSYNSIVSIDPNYLGYSAQSLFQGQQLAAALALGHLALSYRDLKELIQLNPKKNRKRLTTIAKDLGLLGFLEPPIDSLPVFGQYTSTNYDLKYGIEQFIKDAETTLKTGSDFKDGDITQANPKEVLTDPEYYFKELQNAQLLGNRSNGETVSTSVGMEYLRSRVLPFPLGQLLHYTCLAAREEIRNVSKSAFIDALEQGTKKVLQGTLPLFTTIDEIDSFVRVRLLVNQKIKTKLPLKESELKIKRLLERILDEPFERKDWGGEQNDILSTRVTLNGKRISTAFMLKGPSVKGRLTIAKCGKNGDQIQRLFQSPADLFVIQYNGEIDERVIEEGRQKIVYLRSQGRKDVLFTVIDGFDTARLLAAYQDKT